MEIRRVVTGHSNEGKSVVTSDEVVAGFEMPVSPEDVFHVLWGADDAQTYPDDGSAPHRDGWWSPVGGFRSFIWTAPPADAAGDGSQEAMDETVRLMPGLLEVMEPDAPGFHTTDTTDLLYVVSGRIILQLDDGIEVEYLASDNLARAIDGYRQYIQGEIIAERLESSVDPQGDITTEHQFDGESLQVALRKFESA